jgi:hypothetical protein
MSVAAVLGIVLIVGFVGVLLVACIAWRKRMRGEHAVGDWRQAAQDDAAPSSEWHKDSRAVAGLADNANRFVQTEVAFEARGPRRAPPPRTIRNAHDDTAHSRIRASDHRNHRGS